MRITPGVGLYLAGAVLTAIAAFMTWVNYDFAESLAGQEVFREALENEGVTFADDGETATKAGIEADGVITLILAAIAGLFGVLRLLGILRGVVGWIVILATGALILLLGIIDFADVGTSADELEGLVSLSVGIGLILTLVGGGLIVLGAILDVVLGRRRAEPETESTVRA